MSRRVIGKTLMVSLLLLPALVCNMDLAAYDRVPRPEFESDHAFPEVPNPSPRSLVLEYLDVAVLVAFLGAAALFLIRLRNRTAAAWLSVASIAYFGFFRKGCVCSIGALQNAALALFDPTYAIPVTTVLFLILPLISTLLFGRVFCSAVCPLGALQDLVIFRPVRVPDWIARSLRFFPVIYLGIAVLFAATNSDFIICRFDPFVSFFRFGGPLLVVTIGAVFLVAGLFVARPYCRFVCPYGLVLSWLSRVSWRHVTITPDTCVRCGLCKDSCPVDAIAMPSPDVPDTGLVRDRRLLLIMLVIVPALIAAGGLLGRSLSRPLAGMHATVRTADRVYNEDAGLAAGTTLESETFRASQKPTEVLYMESADIIRRYRTGSTLLMVFIALGFVMFSLGMLRRVRRDDYEPDSRWCVSCGRCFTYCPREHIRRRER